MKNKSFLMYLFILLIVGLYHSHVFTAQRSRAFSRQSSSLLKGLKGASPTFLSRCNFKASTPYQRTFFSLKEKQEEIPSFYKDPLIFWNYKPQEDQKKYLFEALTQKLQGKESKILKYDNLETVIELMAEKNIINAKNVQDKTPLMIIIENTAQSPHGQQKRIIKELASQGALLNDIQALSLALKTKNLGALETLQPYFRIKDLYPEFKTLLKEFLTTKNRIHKFQEQPTVKKIFEDHLKILKKELEILDKPLKPIFAEVQEFENGKEQDVLYEIRSLAELYELEKKYSVKLINY